MTTKVPREARLESVRTAGALRSHRFPAAGTVPSDCGQVDFLLRSHRLPAAVTVPSCFGRSDRKRKATLPLAELARAKEESDMPARGKRQA